MAAIQTLCQVDDSADYLMASICDVQTKMSLLHTTVGDLLSSMSETLKSMAEMKSALLLQPTTESSSSQVTVDQIHQDLPVPPPKQSTVVDNNSIDEKQSSRYIHLKKVKVEMPVFEGHNVTSWLTRAERYFRFGNFTEKEKIRLAYMSVEGQALNWFNLWENLEPFVDWKDFKTRLLERFGDPKSAFERLLNLQQVDSVEAYLCQFEDLSSQCLDISVSVREALFVKGLKNEIQELLRLFQPKGSLSDTIAMARRLENSPFCRLIEPKPLD